MESDRSASANGHGVSPPDDSASPSEIARLQAHCQQQAVAIDTLSEAVAALRRGATALKAENAELRTELGGLRLTRRSRRARAAVSPTESWSSWRWRWMRGHPARRGPS